MCLSPLPLTAALDAVACRLPWLVCSILAHAARVRRACTNRYNEIYLPLSYLLRGLQAALEATQPSLAGSAHETFLAAVRQRTRELAHATEIACHEESMGLPHRRRGTLLASRVDGPFINIDHFLCAAMATHEEEANRRQRVVERVVRTYDYSGDGMLQRDEFEAMVRHLSPSIGAEAIRQLWASCGGKNETEDGGGGADGGGNGGGADGLADRSVAVDAMELEAHLFHHEARSAEMQQALHQANGNAAGTGTGGGDTSTCGGDGEMEAVLSLWDAVKVGAEHAEIVERCLSEAFLIVRLQARVRGARARRRARSSASA